MERVQMGPGRFSQPASGQHRPADLHRSSRRPCLPRRLSRPSRLQRAAREAPREESGLDRVHGLPALLAAIADRRGHCKLRYRGPFPGDERVRFEQQVLFPAAGLDPARAAEYYQVQGMVEQLSYAGNEAARQYLNGTIDAAAAATWLQKYSLMTRPRAEQRVRFMDQYRSYVINYNLGKDMVRGYVERHAKGDPTRQWQGFEQLLSSPRLPSGL